jgi:hypothetical protein
MQSSNYADDLLILFNSHFFKILPKPTQLKEFYRVFIEKLEPTDIRITVDVDFDLPGLLMRLFRHYEECVLSARIRLICFHSVAQDEIECTTFG